MSGDHHDHGTLAAELKDRGLAAGLAAVGIASAEPLVDTRRVIEDRRDQGLHGGMQFTYRNPGRSTDPGQALPGARSIVVGALGYERAVPSPPRNGGPRARVARYAWRDFYRPLREALEQMAEVLQAAGHRSRVLADDNALVDRAVAVRAGLGWFGKNANVLLPGQGSWFVLGSVLTSAVLTTDEPLADGCGSCSRCLEGCPTGAIVAPGVVDARRCLAWLVQAPGMFPVEHRVALGDRLYGCDDCQEVCPPNRAHSRRHPPEETHPAHDVWIDVLGILSATDVELLDRFGRWYIPRREPRHLRRNALVVLGNVGDPERPEVVAALHAALAHEDPLVRAHAVWAARRLGLDHLLRHRHDPDADVRAEARRPHVPVAEPARATSTA